MLISKKESEELGYDFYKRIVGRYVAKDAKNAKGKVIIKPAKKNVKAFLHKVRNVIKSSQHLTVGELIGKLNPLIRGWANYHRHQASKQTFARVDHAIFQSLWQWAKRRHPNKPRRWIKEKYFQSRGSRKWVFCGTKTDEHKNTQQVQLAYAHQVPIQRHIKIRSKANPYDPAWELYFEERLSRKMQNDLNGRRQLLYLWQEQQGVCPVCHQKITKLTGWNNHHIIWRVNGGSDKMKNRVLLHPNCHRQVHSQRLTVEKLCPSPGI